jgi:salicylate hydroxylase
MFKGVRNAFAPDFELEWSGHTAFRGIFDASLVDSIEGVPLDSTHWWGPDTNFFATRLARNLFTVQGGIYADPNDPAAIAKFRDGGRWDKEADIDLLREKYVVSSLKRECVPREVLIMPSGLESGC